MFEITIVRPVFRKLIRRFREVAREAYKRALKDWRAETLPRHFQLGASRRYGYHKRSRRYQNEKRQQKHGAPALVWSGDARSRMIQSRKEPQSTRLGKVQTVTIKVPAPRHFFMTLKSRQYGKWPHTMAQEVGMIRKDEVDKMTGQITEDICQDFWKKIPTETVKC